MEWTDIEDLGGFENLLKEKAEKKLAPLYSCVCMHNLQASDRGDNYLCKSNLKSLGYFSELSKVKHRVKIHAQTCPKHPVSADESEQMLDETPHSIKYAFLHEEEVAEWQEEEDRQKEEAKEKKKEQKKNWQRGMNGRSRIDHEGDLEVDMVGTGPLDQATTNDHLPGAGEGTKDQLTGTGRGDLLTGEGTRDQLRDQLTGAGTRDQSTVARGTRDQSTGATGTSDLFQLKGTGGQPPGTGDPMMAMYPCSCRAVEPACRCSSSSFQEKVQTSLACLQKTSFWSGSRKPRERSAMLAGLPSTAPRLSQ